MRRKAEELEQDRDTLKKQVKELTDKVASATTKANSNSSFGLRRNAPKGNNLAEEKVKVSKSIPIKIDHTLRHLYYSNT